MEIFFSPERNCFFHQELRVSVFRLAVMTGPNEFAGAERPQELWPSFQFPRPPISEKSWGVTGATFVTLILHRCAALSRHFI